ncbi:MAG: 5-formyltetrahydrofolate cyclo-ligase [Prevotella sp.]
MDKKQLREYIHKVKRQYSTAQLAEMSSVIMERLFANNEVADAKTILMYHSLPDEVDTRFAIDRLKKEGKKVLLPRVIGDNMLEIREYSSENDLQCGYYNIMEPTGRLYTDYDNIEVCVIPGMAFDRANHRLGRGKGFYDRFLVKVPDTYKIGVCFDFQKVDNVPFDKFDVLMDEVL